MRYVLSQFLLVVLFPSASWASTPQIKLVPEKPIVKDCRDPTRPSVALNSDGNFRVGFFCDLQTFVWTPDLGTVWTAYSYPGKITNASGDYLVADNPWYPANLFDMVNQVVTSFPSRNTMQFNNVASDVFWHNPATSFGDFWSGGLLTATVAETMVLGDSVGYGVGWVDGKVKPVAAFVAPIGYIRNELRLVARGETASFASHTSGKPLSTPDLLGGLVVYKESRDIWVWDYANSGHSWPVATSGLCQSYGAPLLGGSGPSSPHYVLYWGENCGVDGQYVLYVTDIRNPSNQVVYRVDEGLPASVPYKPEYDTENYAVAYVDSRGRAVKFVRFLLP